MISDKIGVHEENDIVQYIVNGLPVYAHGKDDLQAFRCVTRNLINLNLCRQADIVNGFHVSVDTVGRHLRKFCEQGEVAFFSADNRHGTCHKIRGGLQQRVQKKLSVGQSVNSIAKEEGLTEGAIRYAIKQGYLKKLALNRDLTNPATGHQERNQIDSSSDLGIATVRFEERMQAATGQLQEALPVFEPQVELCQAGVLFALPALISQGLLEFQNVYAPLKKGYSGFTSIVLTLAIMALCRIKNPEQLKQCKVGELGRLIGLDRLPETKNLRSKLHQIVGQKKPAILMSIYSTDGLILINCLPLQ